MGNFKQKVKIALLVLSSSLLSCPVFSAVPNSSKAQNVTAQNLGITADQFKTNFNKLASQIGSPQIKAIKLKTEGKGKGFSLQMPNHLAIVGNTDNNNILTRLSVGLDIAQVPKNELGDHSMILGGFAMTAIKAVDQNKNDDKRDDAVQDVYEALWKDKKTFTEQNIKNKIYKNYKLASFSNPRMGVIMIGVEPK